MFKGRRSEMLIKKPLELVVITNDKCVLTYLDN